MRLSEKQVKAVRHLVANPGAAVDNVTAAAGVSDYGHNEADFILRLLRTGAVRLDVTPEAVEVLLDA